MRFARILTFVLVFLVGLLLLVGALTVSITRAQAENARLIAAFAAVVRAEPGWCPVPEGGRVVCSMREGVLTQIELSETDQIVDMKRPVQPPLKKTKGRTH